MNVITDIIDQPIIDPNLALILLLLPIVVTIIGIAKYLIGIKSFGIYAPLILTFMFYEFGLTNDGIRSDPIRGLKYGIFLALIVFSATVISYSFLRRWALHYYSKLALVITIVVFSIIGIIVMADVVNKLGMLKLNIFSLVLIATVSERFMNYLAFNKGTKKAIILSIETLIIAIAAYLFISWKLFQNVILTYPFLVLLVIPVNVLIGKFSGLRVTEYSRFREILNTEE